MTPPQPSKRPSSPTTPITTLKNSIAALEDNINRSQLQQKRSKKENKAALATIRKEIEILHSKISKIAIEDKAHSNRHLQWNQSYRQADEAIALLSQEIDSIVCGPDNDTLLWKQKKSLWDEVRERLSSAKENLLRCQESAQREKSSVDTEAALTQQKRERFQVREAKLNDQRGRLQSASNHGLNEKERREAEQTARATDRLHKEEQYKEKVSSLYREIQDKQNSAQVAWQQARLIENAFHQYQQMGAANQTGCITPEGGLPGTIPHPPTSNMVGFRFPAFAPPDHPTAPYGNLPPLRQGARPRSVSVLSGNSVYTDFSDQDTAPPLPSSRAMEVIRGRQPSRSSGSGSGSVSSQKEAISPITGMPPKKSPVGKRSSPV